MLDVKTGLLTWTPTYTQAGHYQVTLAASDGELSGSETINLDVANVNRAPVFVPVTDQVGREGIELTFTVAAIDPDADPIKLSAVSLPTGATFDESTGLFDWFPGFDQQGDHTVTISAQDAFGAVTQSSIVIHMSNVDLAPVLAASDHNFVIGTQSTFALGGTDPDAGTTLTYKAENLPAGATFDTATGIVTWTPGPGQAGTYTPVFTASDGELSTRQTLVLRATLAPIPPDVRIEVTPSFAGVPGQVISIHPVAAGVAAIASLKLYADGVQLTLDATGHAKITPTQPGRIQLLAVATDVDGTVGQSTLTLKTRDPADQAAPDVTFATETQGAYFTVAGSISGTVSDANLDSWTLEIASGVGATLGVYKTIASGTDPVSGALAPFDPAALQAGFYTLRLTATDMSGRVSSVLTAIEANATVPGAYMRDVTDLTTTLGGVPFSLERVYDSGSPGSALFGPGWHWDPRDVSLQVNAPTTGLEAEGVFAPFADDTRLYLTRPDGVRTGFTFLPATETLGPVTLYHPAWVADDASGGWTLSALTDTTLTRAGSHYYDSTTGLPYNPNSANGAAWLLTGPDGTRYVIDGLRGITEIDTAQGRLVVGDSGITGPDGSSLQLVLDSTGRISRAQTPDGMAVVYTYDDAGRMIAARNIVTGVGERYGYDSQGRLIAAVAVGGSGESLTYGPGGVTSAPITADLGSAGQFTGQTRSDTLGATESIYTFSVRTSEIASVPTGSLILRVALQATSGEVVQAPTIDGLTASSIQHVGDSIVALFAIDHADLYRLHVSGAPGTFYLALSFAGDANLDGKVDGADSALATSNAASADANGDGVVNATDLQLIAADFGALANSAPVLAAVAPSFMTHVDLRTMIDLSTVATDPNGDRVTFRIVSADHATVKLSPDGSDLLFTPEPGFSGVASFTIIADDGYSQSAAAVEHVTVSAAALTHIDFNYSNIQFPTANGTAPISVYADFTDESGVLVPLDYVNARVDDSTVARLTPDGLLTGLADGYTILRADRGQVATATVVAVGTPTDGQLAVSQSFGIDAYPDTVTLISGVDRQIVTGVGTTNTLFKSGAADHVTYVSMNSGIATVSADGLIHGVADGFVDIKVIWGYGEDTVHVKVAAPLVGNTVTIGTAGGVIQNTDGITVGFGPGQLSADATVTVTTLAENQLPIPVPGPGVFTFAGAFNLNIQGGANQAPVQIAVPVAPALASPGDKVYFFQQVKLPTGPNGALQDWWSVVDDGFVGTDGVARSASPPFPGLTDNGNILVARSAQAVTELSMIFDLAATAVAAFMIYAGLNIAATGGFAGAVAGTAIIGAAINFFVLPVLRDLDDVTAWQVYADGKLDQSAITIDMTGAPASKFILPTLPAAPPQPDPTIPVITGMTTTVANNTATLAITVNDLPDLADSHVRFASPAGTIIETVNFPAFKSVKTVTNADQSITYTITVDVPNDVLLGAVKVLVGYSVTAADNQDSEGATVENKAGFGYVASTTFHRVDIIDVLRLDEEPLFPSVGDEKIVRSIAIPGTPLLTLVSQDLSRVFVATDHGIDIIDALTQRLFGHIDVGGDDLITALAVDPQTNYLYAAGTGKVYVIDQRVGSTTFMQKVATLIVAPINNGGYISTIALNGDGTRLFVGSPGSRLFAGPDSFISGGRVQSVISVFDVDQEDSLPTGKQAQYRKLLTSFKAGFDLWKIQSVDATRLVYTDRAGTNSPLSDNGFHTIEIVNNAADAFQLQVDKNPISLEVNKYSPDVSFLIPGFPGLPLSDTYIRSNSQYYDLDNHNSTGVAISPNLQFAFVADYGLPYLYRTNDPTLAYFIETLHDTGAKITVIQDPFGLNGAPVVLGSTTPIPSSYLTDLSIDASGTKLYALFGGVNNVVVYDLKTLEDNAQGKGLLQNFSIGYNYHFVPVDDPGSPDVALHNPQVPFLLPSAVLPGIDVERGSRGLSLDNLTVVTLNKPSGAVDVDSATPETLVFDWTIDTSLLGRQATSDLYVSAEQPGQGLWPDDPDRPRPVFSNGGNSSNIPPGVDGNLNRIFSSVYQMPLKTGHAYLLDVNGKLTDVTDPSHPLNTGETRVTFSAAYAHILTAGQTYYWGVQVDNGTRASGVFTSKPVAPIAGSTYGTVTLITHGFQFDGGDLGPTADQSSMEAPLSFIDMGRLIVRAEGGGVVLEYNKQTGQWVDVDHPGRVGAAALIPGKAVVLVSDWKAESDISDSGFAEAAADAIFASMIDLNTQTGGTLFGDGSTTGSPIHFIGHSRGTAVDSEIVQRFGTYFPDLKNITMTSLDPHDFVQNTLNIPLARIADTIENIITIAQAGLVLGVAAAPEFAVAAERAYKVLKFAKQSIQLLLDAASYLDININPIEYNNFTEPAVVRWNNVKFADTYYQEGAVQDPTIGLAGVATGITQFTATPNGRSIPNQDINISAGPALRDLASTILVVPERAGRTAACGSGTPEQSTPRCKPSKGRRSGAVPPTKDCAR